MGGKYSAEWWEKIADLNRDLPAQDPVSVVDHLIQATAHGARTPAKNGKPSGQIRRHRSASVRSPIEPLRQRRLLRPLACLASEAGPRSPYCKNQGFCTQEPPPPRAVSMHCSNETKVQLNVIVAT